MHVVRGNERNARFVRNFHDERQDLPLFGNAVILNFEIKIVAVDLAHRKCEFLGFFVFPRHEKARKPPRKTGRKTDHALAVFFEHAVIDARAVIKSVDKRHGIELRKIDISRPVLGKQHQMVGTLLGFHR